MKYNRLGSSGLKVSRLAFGTHMNIGHSLDEAQSREILRTAYDGGINFIDAADSYSTGAAESMLGACLPEYRRSDWVVLTKAFGPMGDGPNDRGLSAKHLREACDASLRRMNMDYIDIYCCHHVDPDTPIEETVRTMGDLIRAGKVIYWGVSNWPAARVARANAIARGLGVPPITVCEDRYNLLYRQPESLLFPAFEAEGVGAITFSPLAHGMLAGIYKPGESAPPPGSRAAVDPENPVTKQYYNEEYRRKSQQLVEIAQELDTTAAALATAWCLRNPVVSSVLLGAWTTDQLQENLKAADLTVSDEIAQRLEVIFPAAGDVPQV
ncbi:MAG: aldo/keto reductase [bacterium]|nr:aldo/keto reductase [bacterium]